MSQPRREIACASAPLTDICLSTLAVTTVVLRDDPDQEDGPQHKEMFVFKSRRF
jgi:hypothetical protein